MNDALIWILSIVGLFAVYWALIGQWKHNKIFSNENISQIRSQGNIIIDKTNKSDTENEPNKTK